MWTLGMLWMAKMTRSKVMLALAIFLASISLSATAGTLPDSIFPVHFPCIGAQHDEETEFCMRNTEHVEGFNHRRTIGSTKYYYNNPNIWCEYMKQDTYPNWTNPASDVEPMEVKLYRIEVDGRPLNGWIHVVIKINEKSQFYKEGFGILQMNGRVSLGKDSKLDDVLFHRGGGEFVYDFPMCDGHEHEIHDKVPVEHQFMPCGGVSPADQIMPYGFQYAQPITDPPKYPELVPPPPPGGEPHREFHINFRFSSQACNHPEWLTMATFAHFPVTNKHRFGAVQEILMKPDYVVGAADPIPRPGTYSTINCNNEYSDPKSTTDLKFIKEAPEKLILDVGERTNKQVCSVPPEELFHFARTLFGGRCKSDDHGQQAGPEKKPDSHNNVNVCKPKGSQEGLIDPSTGDKAIEYEDRVEAIKEIVKKINTNCDQLAKQPCPTVPPRPNTDIPTPPAATKRPESTDTIALEKKGITFAGNEAALRIWDSRLIHGILMTILTFFVSPINVFMTRFFKETFLSQRILHLHIWYFVHLLSIGVISFMYLVGLFRIATNQPAGVSLSVAAQIHRALGWSSIAMFILMVLFGGFRAIVRNIRTIIIAAHWTVGVTIYLMNYACTITSIWIPGSPAASVDVSELNKTSLNQLVLFITGIWFLFDIIMNVVMIFMVKSMDKKLGLTRKRFWFPSPIPVISEHETREIVGSKMRKIMLAVYCIVALLVTILICMLIRLTSTENRGLGEMTCTHKVPGGAFAGKGQCE